MRKKCTIKRQRTTVGEHKVVICTAADVKLQNNDGLSEISFTVQPLAKTFTLHWHGPVLLCYCFTAENAFI
jgi:hypothetical protein